MIAGWILTGAIFLAAACILIFGTTEAPEYRAPL